MQVEYRRSDDMPAGLPIVLDEDPSDGHITIDIRADLITEQGCEVLNTVVNALCAKRALVPVRPPIAS